LLKNFILLVFICFSIPLGAQENYIDFFLKKYAPEEGDFIFQDLDSSPLCDAIEEVTPGIFNQSFSHVGMVIKKDNHYQVIEAFSEGVKIIPIHEFLKRSTDEFGVPKIIIAKIHPIFQKENPNLIADAIKKSKKFLNLPYDESFLLNNDAFYCSEFLYEIFNSKNNFFELAPMTFKNSKGEFLEIWIDYFNSLDMDIPENKPGINPGKMTLNKNLKFIYNYKYPTKFN
tara:strand:- start:153 stop:839 length:687 start_codon:yes stop_codon:yes gene_type:complete